MKQANAALRAAGVVVGIVLLVFATVRSQNAAVARRQRFPSEDDMLYLPRASALKPMSLGHHELTADLVFVRALIYFGSQFADKKDYRWLDKYLDTIVALDPYWKTPYRWAGVATMYDGRTITNESVMLSNHFLEMGVERFPNDWELPFMLGCNYLFELKTDDPAQKREWRRRGAEYVRHAALVGGAPSWVPLLAATVMKGEGHDEAAIRHLEEVFVTTQDEKTRDEVRNRLMALHAKIDFKKADQDNKAFVAAWRRTLPYAPPDLFVLVGPKPSPRLDLEHLAHDPVLHLDLDAADQVP
jgi:hypothetical protein